MPSLQPIVAHLETYLRHAEFPDYPQAANGLQLENSGHVTKLGAAVDACEAVIAKAAAHGVSLLLVHHGLMWDPAVFVGGRYRKLKAAMSADLAIFSSHLPLDAHPGVGNAAQFAKSLGLENVRPFFPCKGEPIGVRGQLDVSRRELEQRIEKAVGRTHVCAGGTERVREIGIVTGGAGSEVAEIARTGVDTFITGEGPHWSYTMAEELGLNVFYAGHYATETFGVKALAAHLAEKFALPWEFIDHPTGL